MYTDRNRLYKFISLGVLLIISVVTFRIWFSFYVFAYGDGFFIFSDSTKYLVFPSFWNGGTTLWKYPINFFYGLFGQSGFGTNVAEKFFVMWPIVILGPIAGFLLSRKIFKSNIAGIIGSLIFTYNTYFLSIDTQGHIFLPLGFICGTLALVSFIYFMETKKKFFIPITIIFLFISGCSDFRTLYEIAIIFLLYFLYNQLFVEKSFIDNLKKNIILFFSIFIPLLFLNLFWIIPNIVSSSLASNDFLSRSIIEGNFYNIQNVTASFFPFWTGSVPTWFFNQPVPIYFWLYPSLAFLGLIVGRKNMTVVLFGLLALIGIFLAKQDSAPFGQIYIFFYNHIPGFSAFREASKFYFIIVVSYSVLIASFANWFFNYLEDRKFIKFTTIILIALLPLWNTVPLLTGSIGTMFTPKTIPSNISKVNSYFSQQNDYSRIFWINLNHIWIISSDKHPVSEGNMETVGELEKLSKTYDKNIDLRSNNVEAEKLKTFFESKLGESLLSHGSYGYVVLDLDNTELSNIDISRNAWKNLGKYLMTIKYLKQVDIGAKNILIFKNKDVRPLIYETSEKESLQKDVKFQDIEYVSQNTSHYTITLNKQSPPFYLNFEEKYHPDWKIYFGDFNLVKFLFNKQKQVPDIQHSANPAGFNYFYVDPSEICGSFPCHLTLLFKPQGYVYFGLIISIIVFAGTIGSAIYLYIKKL